MNDKKNEDVLGRKEFVDFLEEVLNSISDSKGNYCISLDGKWGSGKTYVTNLIKERFSQKKYEEKFIVFNYNCWEYDYYDEPIISIISVLINDIDEMCNGTDGKIIKVLEDTRNVLLKILIQLTDGIAEKVTGVSLLNIIKGNKETKKEKKEMEHKYDKYYDFKKILVQLREEMKILSKNYTIIILVDEIDRCLPEYAIKVLERIHHVFYDIENIEVLATMDRTQLEHTIKKIFGKKMDIYAYLKKFFDISIKLPETVIVKSLNEIYKDYFDCFEISPQNDAQIYELIKFLQDVEDIRTIYRVIDNACFAHKLFAKQKKYRTSLLLLEIVISLFSENGDIDYGLKIEPLTFEEEKREKRYNKIAFEMNNFFGSDCIRKGHIPENEEDQWAYFNYKTLNNEIEVYKQHPDSYVEVYFMQSNIKMRITPEYEDINDFEMHRQCARSCYEFLKKIEHSR